MSDLRAAAGCVAILSVALCQSGAVSAQPNGAPNLSLSVDGKATGYSVVLAEDASAPEQMAAKELAAYLGQVTGAEFPISVNVDADRGPVIAVGPGAAKAVEPEVDLSRVGDTGLGEDGIVIRTVGANLVLTGAEGSLRGTLYAVQEFLERACGVRWWTPTAETVPSRPTLAVGPLDVRYRPAFLYRETLCPATTRVVTHGGTAEVPLFAVRMRQNGHFPRIPREWGGHYTIIGWCHTFFHDDSGLLPPNKYFEEHPEWYSEIDGKRTHERAQLCMTNDEMLQELARNVLAEIRRQPDAGIISVSQNDHRGNCQCARCRAMDEAEGSPAGSLLYGINRVAEIVERDFPEFLISTLAYSYTRNPPRTIRPRDNVVIRYCVIERSALQPIEHPMNRELLDDLEGWARTAPNMAIWDYTANLRSPFTPEPRAAVYGPDMRLYRRCNAKSVFCEHSHGASPTSDFEPLHTWLLSRLLWDPGQDERALTREFLDGYFGPAGRAIESYLCLLSGAGAEARVRSWSHPHDAEWLDVETMNRATVLMDAAEAAVAAGPVLLKRVRDARLSLDHQWLAGYTRYAAARLHGARMLGPDDLATAISGFIDRARAAGVAQFGYGRRGPTTIEAHGEFLREDNALSDNQRYLASLAGEPAPLPEGFAQVARYRVVDLQEHDLRLFDGADVVTDEAASNGAAVKLDPAVSNWSVQKRELPTVGVAGRWRAYAVVRCEAIAAEGIAFVGGVYDSSRRAHLTGFAGRIEADPVGETQPEDIDATPGVTVAAIGPSPANLGDGQYHLVDFGVHHFGDATRVWVGTTGGVSPQNVRAIYVDRIILVRAQ